MFDPARGLFRPNRLARFIEHETSFIETRRATRSPVVFEVFYFHVFLRRILAFFVYFVLSAEIRVRSCLLLTLSPVNETNLMRPQDVGIKEM